MGIDLCCLDDLFLLCRSTLPLSVNRSRLDKSQMSNHRSLTAASLYSTFHILHDHAEMTSCLKRAEHRDDEGVLGKSQDVSLHKSLLDLVPQNQVLPINLFHGEPLAGLLVTDEIHSPVKKKQHAHTHTHTKLQLSVKRFQEDGYGTLSVRTWKKNEGGSLAICRF